MDDLGQTLNPDTDNFYANKITIKKLQEIVEQNELKQEKPIKLAEIKRFKTPELKYIEGHLFKTQSTKYEQKVENLQK